MKSIGNTRVAVFGGSGFLGSHVADALSDKGYKVRIFDRNPSPYLRPDQEMVIGDILDLPAVVKAARNCDFVYNFAGLASLDDARDRPLDTLHLNVLGNGNVLEAARRGKARRFVFASSLYIFSDEGSFYRASKQSAERFVEAYQDRYGLDFTILRYGSLYGRRSDERNSIFNLLKQAHEKKSIVYDGNPDAIREYIHATDAARLSVQILAPEYVNRHLILTGHERLKVGDVVRLVAEVCPDKVKIKFGRKAQQAHYVMTPYSFDPKLGKKLVANEYVGLGAGIMDCLSEIHELSHSRNQSKAKGA